VNRKLLVLARKREVARPEGAAPKKAPRTRWLDRGAAARSGWGQELSALVDRKHVRAPNQSANSAPSPTPPSPASP
jgi:hypothetical protein